MGRKKKKAKSRRRNSGERTTLDKMNPDTLKVLDSFWLDVRVKMFQISANDQRRIVQRIAGIK